MNNTVDPTTIGAFVTVILAFLGVAKIMLNQSTRDREADRKERIESAEADRHERRILAEAINKMADPKVNGNERVAQASERQAEESKQRNGHLGEMILEQGKQTAKLIELSVNKTIKGVQNIKTQHVHDQKVDNTTVINEIVTNKGE